MIALTLYLLVAAAVFGALLHRHLAARHDWDKVPPSVLFGAAIGWLPIVILLIGMLLVAILREYWSSRGGQ